MWSRVVQDSSPKARAERLGYMLLFAPSFRGAIKRMTYDYLPQAKV